MEVKSDSENTVCLSLLESAKIAYNLRYHVRKHDEFLQNFAAKLAGREISFVRGRSQRVDAEVVSWNEGTRTVQIVNKKTKFVYSLDITTVVIDAISDSKDS